MIIPVRRWFCAMAALMLTACASEPARYHTLAPLDYDRQASPPAPAPFLLEVLPVRVPVEADRLELVVRQGGSIALIESERWAATLGEEFQDAFSAMLSSKLGAQNVSGFTHPLGKPVLRVKLIVRRFESVPGQYALIDADWSIGLADKEEKGRLLCNSQLRIPVKNGYRNLVDGHRKLIDRLAGQIASRARDFPRSASQACPSDSARI